MLHMAWENYQIVYILLLVILVPIATWARLLSQKKGFTQVKLICIDMILF